MKMFMVRWLDEDRGWMQGFMKGVDEADVRTQFEQITPGVLVRVIVLPKVANDPILKEVERDRIQP